MLEGCSLKLDSDEFRVVQHAPSRNSQLLIYPPIQDIKTSKQVTTQAGLMPDRPGSKRPHEQIEYPVESCRHPQAVGVHNERRSHW